MPRCLKGLTILFAISALTLHFTNSNASTSKIDSFSVSVGKQIFISHCSGCHGSNGTGAYGPNLCDNVWIHGHHYHNIRHVIHHGVPKKGMTSFKHTLNHAQTRDVAHYVYLNLKGSKP